MKTKRASLAEPLGVVAAFALAGALIGPVGDFPLNDDAHFALPAFHFAQTGEFHLTGAAASMRALVVWGGLWVRLFGESYEVLRLSTLTLAALTIVVVNRMLDYAGAARPVRVLATLAFAFHPLFFWSSFTFMTEVPFVFASAVALLLQMKGLREDRPLLLLAADIAVAVSWWIRQTGVVNALAPIVVLILFRERISPRWRSRLLLCLAPLAVFVAIFVTHREWISGLPADFAQMYAMWGQETFRLPQQIALVLHYVFFTAQSVALFLLPLSLLVIRWHAVRRGEAVLLGAVGIVFAGILAELLSNGVLLPYMDRICCDIMRGNIFHNFGLGPPTLPDVWSGRFAYPFALGRGTRAAFSVMAAGLAALVTGAAVLAVRGRFSDLSHGVLLQLAAVHTLASVALLCVSGYYFDRYSLDAAWSMALVLALIARPVGMRAGLAAGVALAAVALFSTLAVGEYFAWNRARWSAYHELRQRGVPLTSIDGGSEPFQVFEVAYVRDMRQRRRLSFGPGERRFVIAFHPMPGFRVVATHPFRAWLGLHRGQIVTLERIARVE